MGKKRQLGPSFPEQVVKVTAKNKLPSSFAKEGASDWIDILVPNFHPGSEEAQGKGIWRIVTFATICLVLFFIIFLRLFRLQIVEGAKNKELADSNRIQVKIIHSPRGVIFDRNGKILAANSPAFRLFDQNTKKARFITREEALKMEAKNDPEAANLEIDNVRTYLEGEKFAHVLGYVGQISEEQLQKDEYKNYRLGDSIGQMGAEAQFEGILRGIDGGEIIEVDSKGRKLRTLRVKNPIPGQNIYLSIDAELQERIYQLITEAASKSKSCCGAAIAMDPASGQVLALLSLPSFDPNLFTDSETDEGVINELLTRLSAPILNRAIAGTYPPGSTFKIISSLAALGSGVSAETFFQDTGVMYIGPYKFSNWYFNQYGKVEGPVNLVKALQRSNDTYFYKIAQIVGQEKLSDWAKKLHLGSKLGIDLPGEEEGLVPDGAWKEKTYGQVWYPGDSLHMAIGQGFVLTTPLQILGITSYIAGGGALYKPELLLKESPEVLVSNLLPKEKVGIIKEGLELVPKAGGTAWPFFSFPLETAGKTGTAEYGDPKNRTHAWYTSFAPADDPKIVLTVLLEGAGEGSSVAAPIAKEAYRWYFSPDKNKLIQDVYTSATESGRALGE